jgi:copper chaperone CopZ
VTHGAYNPAMAVAQETIRMTGIRCERCVGRLAAALRGHEGLESASANLVGDVTLEWDEERTSRDELLTALARAGFRETSASPAGWE